jgi:hypothetical protein
MVILSTLLFADGQIIFARTKKDFQMATQPLNRKTNYNLEMSSEKTNSMIFCSERQIRSLMMANDKIAQQVENFSYLGCNIFHYCD